MYSSTFSVTSTLYGDGWSKTCPGRFTPGNDTIHIIMEAGWVPGSRPRRVRKSPSYRDLISGPSSPYRVVIPTDPSRLTVNT
jgi:hypothetical protein